ncbi:hypothetical protein [Flavobacterium sp.]|jgi:hypothetical protein|uniref:hypothetical protein n=1 Tax=Flavobacterium sp. TaxID=239 RepID=UPI0037BEEDEF
MKNIYLTQGMVKKNYRCSLLGHQYVETKKINLHFSEFECTVCRTQATNDSRGNKITLTTRLKDINETLFYLNLKKQFLSRFYFQKKEQ